MQTEQTTERIADIDVAAPIIAPAKGHEARARIQQLLARVKSVEGQLTTLRGQLEVANAKIDLIQSQRDLAAFDAISNREDGEKWRNWKAQKSAK